MHANPFYYCIFWELIITVFATGFLKCLRIARETRSNTVGSSVTRLGAIKQYLRGDLKVVKIQPGENRSEMGECIIVPYIHNDGER